MGIKYQRGFTIIETVLFLAITGVLVVAILAGTGTAVNQQRYRDSVNSFVSLLQDQYASATAVHNDRNADWTCTDTTGLTQTADTATPRGASDCAIIGQVIRTTDGANVTTESIVARNITSALASASTSDVTTLQAMQLQSLGSVDASQIDTHQLEWGATLGKPGGSGTAAFSILIVRSPASGTIRTFVDPSHGTTKLADLINSAYISQGITLCVDSQGLFVGGGEAVELLPNSASATGVRIKGTDPTC